MFSSIFEMVEYLKSLEIDFNIDSLEDLNSHLESIGIDASQWDISEIQEQLQIEETYMDQTIEKINLDDLDPLEESTQLDPNIGEQIEKEIEEINSDLNLSEQEKVERLNKSLEQSVVSTIDYNKMSMGNEAVQISKFLPSFFDDYIKLSGRHAVENGLKMINFDLKNLAATVAAGTIAEVSYDEAKKNEEAMKRFKETARKQFNAIMEILKK